MPLQADSEEIDLSSSFMSDTGSTCSIFVEPDGVDIKRTKMLPRYVEIIRNYCIEHNMILIFRPIGSVPQSVIESGAVAAKEMDIKGKTLEYRVPVDQAFSKLGVIERDLNVVKLATRANKKKLAEDFSLYRKYQLFTGSRGFQRLSLEQQENLKLQLSHLTVQIARTDDQGRQVFGIKKDGLPVLEHGKPVFVYLDYKKHRFYKISSNELYKIPQGAAYVAIHDMGYRAINKKGEFIKSNTIIPDYDIFTMSIIGDYEEHEGDLIAMEYGIGPVSKLKEKLSLAVSAEEKDMLKEQIKQRVLLEKEVIENKYQGFATRKGHKIISELKVQLDRFVSHGPESSNPDPEAVSLLRGEYVCFDPDGGVSFIKVKIVC